MSDYELIIFLLFKNIFDIRKGWLLDLWTALYPSLMHKTFYRLAFVICFFFFLSHSVCLFCIKFVHKDLRFLWWWRWQCFSGFWCHVVAGRYQRFGETSCLHLQGRRWRHVSVKGWLLPMSLLHTVTTENKITVIYVQNCLIITLLVLSECLLEFAAVSQIKGRGVSYYHDCKFDFIIDIT